MSNDVQKIQRRVRKRANIYRTAFIVALLIFVSTPVVWIRFLGMTSSLSISAAIVLISTGWWLLAFLAETALHLRYKLFSLLTAIGGILLSRLIDSALLADVVALGMVVLSIVLARKAIDLDEILRDLLANRAPFNNLEAFASRHSFTTIPLLVFGHVLAFFPTLGAMIAMLELGNNSGVMLILILLLPIQILWLWAWAMLTFGATTDTRYVDVEDMRSVYNEILTAALQEYGMKHVYVEKSHDEREWGYDGMLTVTILDAIHHHVISVDTVGRKRMTSEIVLGIIDSESPLIVGQINAHLRPSCGVVLRPVDEQAQIRIQEVLPILEKMLGETVTLAPVQDDG